MVNFTKISAEWTGFSGAPGYSNFYMNEVTNGGMAGTQATAARTMLNSLVGYLPNNLTIRFTGLYQTFDAGTGTLVTQGTYTPSANVTGTNTTAYSAVSGACIRWVTASVVNGRILVGRTFLVPLVGMYDTDGTLAPAFITTLLAAANTYVGSVSTGSAPGKAAVWHRPNASLGTPGYLADISGAVVSDRAAILRSRRS